MTSFFHCCPPNLTFLVLQCPYFNQRSTNGNQTSQISPNWNKRSLTRSKDLQKIRIRKSYFEVAVWRHFSVNARPIWHSLHCNVQFSIRWVPMQAKLLKLNQIESKSFYLDPKTFQNILVWSCCVTSFFRLCSANLTFLTLQCPYFNQRSTNGNQSSQIKPKLKQKISTLIPKLCRIS